MEGYTFERLWKELNEGYQIYYTYMENRYLLAKLSSNCYSRKLVNNNDNIPHPKEQIVTLKTIKETFPFMEDIEYKVNI